MHSHATLMERQPSPKSKRLNKVETQFPESGDVHQAMVPSFCITVLFFNIFKWVLKTIGQMYKLKAKFVNKTNWMGIMFPWVYGIKWIVNEKLGFICATISY